MQAVGNIKVGGNVVGSAVAAGNRNIQTVTFSGPDAAEREKVLDALQAIQIALNDKQETCRSCHALTNRIADSKSYTNPLVKLAESA